MIGGLRPMTTHLLAMVLVLRALFPSIELAVPPDVILPSAPQWSLTSECRSSDAQPRGRRIQPATIGIRRPARPPVSSLGLSPPPLPGNSLRNVQAAQKSGSRLPSSGNIRGTVTRRPTWILIRSDRWLPKTRKAFLAVTGSEIN